MTGLGGAATDPAKPTDDQTAKIETLADQVVAAAEEIKRLVAAQREAQGTGEQESTRGGD